MVFRLSLIRALADHFLVLTSTNTLTIDAKLSYADVNIGIPSIIVCIKVIRFTCLSQYAYSASRYYIRNRESQVTDDINQAEDENSSGYKSVDSKRAYQEDSFLYLRAWPGAVGLTETVTVLVSVFACRRAPTVQETFMMSI